ncbi:NKAP family protein [Actinidia chinensis var. chinensis]|uniref:NKAP family protein n=1 Tax=Actinidia chinensis var. chinensis TaxID=1590841 RepID=A0A2R6QA40_ACTCC|nr:NKAP family protein [Actinidia chinensis var. chinensis]
MAGERRQVMMIHGGNSSRTYGRPIPRRGEVKVAIVVKVANSLASLIFSSKNGSHQLSR